jgi:RNA polymerase sigma-70 factor (ECF subfamily)
MTESYAIKCCLKYHDSRGFEFLVQKYRKEAFYHAMIFLGNREDAVDACQESFTRAFIGITRLSHLDHFYPWFYRILKNCCLNMIRKEKTFNRYKNRIKTDTEENSDTSNPSAFIDKKEDQERIWGVLNELSPEFREILVMKYIQDKHYDEISTLLSIPRGTVMSRLYYARKAFRDIYLKAEKTEISI